MATVQKISPCLWFDNQAVDAAKFYTGIFERSKILKTTHYGGAGQEIHKQKPGSVMTVDFSLDGQTFTALNGGPMFKFNEAISFQVSCKTQDEIDHYWDKLGAGGKIQQCGWLKDKFGVSWQIVPEMLAELYDDANPEQANRAMTALLKMKKLDIAQLRKAFAGD